MILRWVKWANFKFFLHIHCFLYFVINHVLLSVSDLVPLWKSSPSRKFLQSQNESELIWVCCILVVWGKNSNPLPKLIFLLAKVVLLIWWIWLRHQSFWLSAMFFSTGRTSWLLSSFKFLIVCLADVKLFVRGEKLLVISIGVEFSNLFLIHAEWRGINHLCCSSDAIDPDRVAFVFWERYQCSFF